MRGPESPPRPSGPRLAALPARTVDTGRPEAGTAAGAGDPPQEPPAPAFPPPLPAILRGRVADHLPFMHAGCHRLRRARRRPTHRPGRAPRARAGASPGRRGRCRRGRSATRGTGSPSSPRRRSRRRCSRGACTPPRGPRAGPAPAAQRQALPADLGDTRLAGFARLGRVSGGAEPVRHEARGDVRVLDDEVLRRRERLDPRGRVQLGPLVRAAEHEVASEDGGHGPERHPVAAIARRDDHAVRCGVVPTYGNPSAGSTVCPDHR